jgi:hypothetical protein
VHAGVPQARERIAGLFWPESADGQALTNLRRELHHVRQVLAEEPSLVVTSRDLCWRDTETCRVDVRVFVFAVSAGGVLYAFAAWRTRYLDSVSARRLARIPLSLLLLELSGYCVSAVQLHVHAADVLVRRGVGGDGSRSAVLRERRLDADKSKGRPDLGILCAREPGIRSLVCFLGSAGPCGRPLDLRRMLDVT